MNTKSFLFIPLLLLQSCTFPFFKQSDSASESVNSQSDSISCSVSESYSIDEGDKMKRVVIIGVDGAGHNFTENITPTTCAIFKDYAKSYDVLTSNPTISAQCWGSLLTGVIPSLHGFTNDNIVANANSIYDTFPTIFKVLHDANPEAKMASFANWNAINMGIVENNISVHKRTRNDDGLLTADICDYLDENSDTQLLFVQFDSVDHAGHTFGYDTENYYKQLTEVDDFIGSIFVKYEDLGLLDDTLFIVTADHGGYNKSHGGLTDAEKYVFFGARNQNINNIDINNMYIRDIPAIVCEHLGITPSSSFDSFIPDGMFKDNLHPLQRTTFDVNHQAIDTPNINENLLKHFNVNDFKTGLLFDDDLSDISSNNVSYNGKIYYENGYYGKACKISNEGYINLDDVTLEDDESFAIASWIKIEQDVSEDPLLLCNKNWELGKNSGLAIAFRANDIKLSIGYDGKSKDEGFYPYPDGGYKNKWMHLMLNFDMSNKKVYVYVNFILVGVTPITGENTVVGQYELKIGQDGRGTYNVTLNYLIDDFFIFNKKLSDEDIKYLKDYYK